jgi:hypothetical protein
MSWRVGVSLAASWGAMEQGEFCAETGHHGVQFYADDGYLSDVVARFLAEGLQASRPAVVIATPEHRAAVNGQLAARGIDVEGCIRRGVLQMLDAEDTLAQFMVNGMPDRARFKVVIGTVLARLSGTPRPRIVRATARWWTCCGGRASVTPPSSSRCCGTSWR